MAISLNPFTGQLDLTGSGGMAIGGPIAGSTPHSLLAVSGTSTLAQLGPLTDGQLLIGSTGGAAVAATLTGTSNQLTVTNASGSITLSLPQDIAITSSPQFANLILTPSGSLDITAAGGTLAIGTANADIINIGGSGVTVNVQGDTFYQNVTNLQVTDKLITINKGGSAGSASNAGIEIEENSLITAYIDTSADRNSWELKAPATAGIVTITPGALGFTIDQGSHDPVTIGTANGLSLSTQALSMALANGIVTGTLSATDYNTFNDKIGSINGDTTVAQTLVTASTGTDFTINTLAGVSTFAIPSSSATNRGLLTSADWSTFNDKLTSVLTDGKIFVGSALNVATEQTMSGDATIINTGALTLATVNSNVGTFNTLTVNAKGLVTAASNTAYEVPLTFSTGLTRTIDTITVNTSQNISILSNLTTNGFVKTTGGTGTLSIDTNSYVVTVADDIVPTSWAGLADNTANQVITGFTFATTVSSFEALLNIYIDATSDLFTTVKIVGTRQSLTDWTGADIQWSFTGMAITGLDFSITAAGQMRISVGTTAGFASGLVKFRATSIS